MKPKSIGVGMNGIEMNRADDVHQMDIDIGDKLGLEPKTDLILLNDLFDEGNPYSVINLLPPRFQNQFNRVNVRKMLNKSESEHRRFITHCGKLRSKSITAGDLEDPEQNPMVHEFRDINRIRMQFWYEYTRSINSAEFMVMKQVYLGVCGYDKFDKYLDRDEICAWILRKPVDYKVVVDEALDYGLGKLRDILDFPLYVEKFDKEGNNIGREPNVQIANLVMRVIDKLDLRRHGSPTQKILSNSKTEKTTKNLNLDAKVDLNQRFTKDIPLIGEDAERCMERINNKLQDIGARN